MAVQKHIKSLIKFQGSKESLTKECVAFSGIVMKHPHHAEKRIILLTDPFSQQTSYYDFAIDDVTYLEEQPIITPEEGETILLNKLWIKNDAIALQVTPFIVGDTRKSFSEILPLSS